MSPSDPPEPRLPVASSRGPETGSPPGVPVDPAGILVVRRGPGANCSSVGSVLDLLFLSATLGGAVLVAVTAALGRARAVPDVEPPAPPPAPPSGGAGAG